MWSKLSASMSNEKFTAQRYPFGHWMGFSIIGLLLSSGRRGQMVASCRFGAQGRPRRRRLAVGVSSRRVYHAPRESRRECPSFERAVLSMADGVLGGRLTLTRLTKRYPGTTAVDAIDLDVGSGEFVTLLGPSGSGKTTTLMMVAGFTAPSEGEIAIDGRPITGMAPEHRNIGVVFQNYALFPHMTVWDNVAFPLKMRRRPSV